MKPTYLLLLALVLACGASPLTPDEGLGPLGRKTFKLTHFFYRQATGDFVDSVSFPQDAPGVSNRLLIDTHGLDRATGLGRLQFERWPVPRPAGRETRVCLLAADRDCVIPLRLDGHYFIRNDSLVRFQFDTDKGGLTFLDHSFLSAFGLPGWEFTWKDRDLDSLVFHTESPTFRLEATLVEAEQ